MIDTHAHYSVKRFDRYFRYLISENGEFSVAEGTRERLFADLRSHGIEGVIEPAIDVDSNYLLLKTAREQPGFVFPAVGAHPTRCIYEPYGRKKELAALIKTPGVVAVGETGLDYHHERKKQRRMRQKSWFRFQLSLARKNRLPLILHIRQADRDALRILRRRKGLSGVVHCFSGGVEEANAYVALGLHLGIGGAILQSGEGALRLREAVLATPLDRILLETDAPYVLPECEAVRSARNLRNSSRILPAVAIEIARIKGEDPQTVLRVTTENAKRLFGI